MPFIETGADRVKIYTKKGDAGTTSLANGERVQKHDHRVEMYGTTDELNSVLGLVASAMTTEPHLQMLSDIQDQQSLMLELGAELAGFYRNAAQSVIEEADIEHLEVAIDEMTAVLPPLTAFILPGGNVVSAHLQFARTVCRRLERHMTAVSEEVPGSVLPIALKYVNRLSDYLFTAARYANHLSGIGDIEWISRQKRARRAKKEEAAGS